MPVCVNVNPSTNVARLNTAIEDRARELGLSLNEVARKAGISTETLSALRGKGKKRDPQSRPYAKTARGVDLALEWREGTTLAILDGKQIPSADDDPAIVEIRNKVFLSDEEKQVLIDHLVATRNEVLVRAERMNQERSGKSA